MRSEWTHAETIIRQGLEWFRVEQPAGSMVTHLGLGAHAGGGLWISFAPSSFAKHKQAIVIVEVGYDGDGKENPRLTVEEVAWFKSMIVRHGATVTDEWNGAGWVSGSFAIADEAITRTLLAAERNYLKGCPKPNHSVFCGQRASWGLDPDKMTDAQREKVECDWWQSSRSLLIEPSFTIVPKPAPSAPPDPTDDDRNLEAVRLALERLAPTLARMEIVNGLVCAGKRGDIVGEPGDLSFEPRAGHGVTMPAELAVSLIERLAELEQFLDG